MVDRGNTPARGRQMPIASPAVAGLIGAPLMNPLRLLPLGGLLAVLVLPCSADLTLASPFTDHAVLQREVAVPVWGWDTAGGEITVTFGGQTRQTRVNASGGWRVDLEAMPANATGADLEVKGSATV